MTGRIHANSNTKRPQPHELQTSLVGLDSRQLQQLPSNLWLLEWLISVQRILNTISHWRALFVDVAMWPMRCPVPALEERGFLRERFLCGELCWCLADVLHVADAVTFRKTGIVHCAAVPESLAEM